MTMIKEKLLTTKVLVAGFALAALLSIINSVVAASSLIPCIFGFGQPELPASVLNKIKENETK